MLSTGRKNTQGTNPVFLGELCRNSAVAKKRIKNNMIVKKLSYDSRKIENGSLFFALKGLKDDGNNYIESVVKKGAAGVFTSDAGIYEKYNSIIDIVLVKDAEEAMSEAANIFYGDILGKMQLIGITGTNGKSSTAIFLNSIIRSWNRECGLLGTIYNDFGNGLVKSTMTTPLSLDSLELFANMYSKGIRWVVMEVSSHSIHRKRIHGFPFFIGALTNISQDHLDYHGNIEEYARVKYSFFDYVTEDGYCIIPYSYLEKDELKKHLISRSIVSYNHEKSDYFIKRKKYSQNMFLLWIRTREGEISISTRYMNDFMHENLLLAIAIAKTIGITNSYIAKAVENVIRIPGRVELVYDGRFSAYIDYAHTPEAIMRVTREFKGLNPSTRIITIFGAGGNKDKSKRPIMGKYASLYSDVIFLTSDNPRDEDPSEIIYDIYNGIENRDDVKVFIQEDREKAIEMAVESAQDGDIILLLGKGHEEFIEAKGSFSPFNDREILKKYTDKRDKDA